MSLLSAADLAQLRGTFATMLPDRAVIQRPTQVSDGGGGYTTTWANLTDAPCRLAPVGGGEGDGGSAGDRLSDSATAMVTFEAGQDITTQDRLVISGRTYLVLLVRRRAAFELTKRVEVKEA